MNEETEVIEETPEETIEDTEVMLDEGEAVQEEPEEVVEEPVEEPIDPEKLEIETRGKDDEPVEYGEDIDPDDAKTIGSIVEKQTAGVKRQLQATQDRLEVDAFIAEKPEFSKYRPVIMKYLQHPVYSKIPVKNIAAMVASNDLVKLGAKMERETQAKADSTKVKGSPARKQGGSQTDWTRASKDEFEAQKRVVLGQRV